MTLQAYTDDSGKLGDSPVCVLAGYISTAERWATFSNEWQAALHTPPKICYFKSTEAMHRQKQFQGFCETQRDQKLRDLVEVVRKYADAGIVSVIPTEPFKRLMAKWAEPYLRRPYFLLFHGIIAQFCLYAQEENQKDEIDFYFDTQDDEPAVIGDLQTSYRLFVEAAPPELKCFVGDPPMFRNEKKVLPLQAADLMAWHARRVYHEVARGRLHENAIVEQLFHIKHRLHYWSEERLSAVVRDLLQAKHELLLS